MENDEVTKPRADEMYDFARMPVPVDASSSGRGGLVIPATAGGYAPLDHPLNTGQCTRFNIQSTASDPIRLSTTCMRVRGYFTDWTGTADAPFVGSDGNGYSSSNQAWMDAPYDSVDPFMIAAAINTVTLNINGSNFVNTTPNYFMYHYMASLIGNHSKQSLEKHPGLFHPIFDDHYTAASMRKSQATGAGCTPTPTPGEPFACTTDPPTVGSCCKIGNKMYCRNPARPPFADAATAPFMQITHPVAVSAVEMDPPGDTEADKIPLGVTLPAGELINTFTDSYNKMCSANAAIRARNYIHPGSKDHPIDLFIPLCDLTNVRTPGIIPNMHDIMLEIRWNNNTDLCTHFTQNTLANDKTHQSTFRITNCDIITDSYIPMPDVIMNATTEKLETNGSAKIAWEDISIMPVEYTPNAAIQWNGCNNLQRLFVFAPIRDLTNGPTQRYFRTGSSASIKTAGNAVSTSMVYNAWSQLSWIGNTGTNPDVRIEYPWCRERANEPLENGDGAPVTSAYMMYNGKRYPQREITCAVEGNPVFDQMYIEYLKSVSKLDKRDSSAAVDPITFATTMPFLALKPWSDNGPHITDNGGVLTVALTGGCASRILLVAMRFRAATLEADNSAKVPQ